MFSQQKLLEMYSEEDFIKYFPPDSEFVQITRFFKQKFRQERQEIEDPALYEFPESGKKLQIFRTAK